MRYLSNGFGSFAVLATLLSLPFSARSDDAPCTYRTVYDSPDSPIHDIPIYDQGNTTLCYAYTAAQMTEYYLRKLGEWPLAGSSSSGSSNGISNNGSKEHHIPPLWVAVNYKGSRKLGIRFRKNNVGNGYIQTALADLGRAGFCDSETYDREISKFKNGISFNDADFLLFFEGFWQRRRNRPDEGYAEAIRNLLKNRVYGNTVKEMMGHEISEEDEMSSQEIPGDMTPEIPPGIYLDLKQIFETVSEVPFSMIQKKEKMDYLKDVVLASCKGDQISPANLPKRKAFGLGFGSNSKLKRLIDEKLNLAESEPIGIGYCSRVYSSKPGGAVKRKAFLPRFLRLLNDGACGAHYSMVVGRRPAAGGSCEYLVRNTAGKGFWSKNRDCLCEKKNGAGYENCRFSSESKTSDRVVGCWVGEEPLLNSTYDLSVMSN